MSKYQDLIEVLEGRIPSITSYTIYDWNMERSITGDDLHQTVIGERQRAEKKLWRLKFLKVYFQTDRKVFPSY